MSNYNTYNGWKRLGRVVDKGEKGMFMNEYGDYMFHKNQTVVRGRVVETIYDSRGRRVQRTISYV